MWWFILAAVGWYALGYFGTVMLVRDIEGSVSVEDLCGLSMLGGFVGPFMIWVRFGVKHRDKRFFEKDKP